MRIGVEIAVALDFDIGEQTHEALFGKVSAKFEASLAGGTVISMKCPRDKNKQNDSTICWPFCLFKNHE